jgi:1,4-dihydroxy-2-naphthoate octaprenyltransferase
MDRDRLVAMIRMGRFPLLFGGFLLFLLGALTAVAAGHPFSPALLIVGYAILGPAHLSVHYSNDCFDADGDRLGTPTGVSGGSGMLARYPDLRPAARLTALLLIVISCIAGLAAFLTVLPTPLLPLLVVIGNGLGWFYSAPPVRLSSWGLGEASTAATFGLLLPGMGYLAIAGGLEAAFLLATIPLTILGVTFILAVEMPDREADALSGKMTFIVRHGIAAGLKIVLLSSALASTFLILATATGNLPLMGSGGIFVLASFIPLGSSLAGYVSRPGDGEGLTRFARHTVLSLILFAALVDAALALLFP